MLATKADSQGHSVFITLIFYDVIFRLINLD
jgi:hypothetical protein